ncbi:formate dehydrogenase accessory protein [Desulfonatronospira thiodismutans ASO3-1]|uniref:Formate dehydrogenase accessory protein n=1 Tax=Desulfonatronospira thiodismutans ASO3-1 TaxID=555779 RepID=D6STD8_9BACT|nr:MULTISPECIES: formate dehydrogenase accessory protein FdhE [Desulfonatronospira]EFI33954.1 formate dehydrogenase accessory protein [Desulfonatronospira thiodismutans ASO3-1]RQD75228.1 MAG: formate dehydrogenase accessory protein FdhE [Desulfonatronospira sp. MSAO_Bac3]
MFTQPEKSLKIYKKRKKPLEQKSFLPKELTQLVDFIIKNQLEAAEKASPENNPHTSLASSHEVLSGKPLLPREEFPLDFKTSRELALKILKFMADSNEHLVQSMEVIQKEMDSDPEFLDMAMKKYLEGDDDFFRSFGEKTPSAPRSLNFLVQSAAAPSLAKTADSLSLALPAQQTFQSGHCPVCGSLPYIAELREKQGFRYLHCSFCHTAYRFKRMACPYCAVEKSDSFEYFHTREIPGFRVDLCTSCNMYIKTMDFREMDKKALPPLDDLESLPLDIKAKEEGYIRPTLSAWGF